VTPDPLRPLAELEGVPSGMASARDAVDALLRDRGLRMRTPEEDEATAAFLASGQGALVDPRLADVGRSRESLRVRRLLWLTAVRGPLPRTLLRCRSGQ